MNILITGGAGFIGSHLSELVLDDGDDAIALVSSRASANGCCAVTQTS